MPIDSTNYGREIKNLRAEIADLRTEVAFMYSAFQSIQEQFGFALAEIANLIKNLNGEIKNLQQENSAEKNFDLLRDKISVLEKNFSQQISQNISATDSVNENFSRIEKISETQQLNFRNYFDKIENSLSAQQKIFSDIFNQQSADFEKNFNALQSALLEKVSGVGENVSVVQKNLAKFSSEVDEILADNQKNLLKKFDSANNKPKDFLKTLNAIEEMLRLIAANQLLNEVQQNFPNSYKKTSLGNKKFFIYGHAGVGKSTLAEILQKRFEDLEIKTLNIENYYTTTKPDADLIIYIIDGTEIGSAEVKRFKNLRQDNERILFVINDKMIYENDKIIYEEFYHDVYESRQVASMFNIATRMRNIYDKFLDRVGHRDSGKISEINVNLKLALRGAKASDGELLILSGFSELEKFIHEN